MLIYIIISKERRCNDGLRGVGNFKIERVLDSYCDFSEGQLNTMDKWTLVRSTVLPCRFMYN